MTLEEAKEFYFQYDGFSFHMDREDPVRYGRFRMLNPGKDILREWDGELLDDCFKRLRTEPGRVWIMHGKILKIIRRNNCDAKHYLNRLLDEMEKMEDLDSFNRCLIIENMAGRKESLNDGGVYIFCRYSNLAERMNDITERLISAGTALPADERFEKAARRYRSAYRRWSSSV